MASPELRPMPTPEAHRITSRGSGACTYGIPGCFPCVQAIDVQVRECTSAAPTSFVQPRHSLGRQSSLRATFGRATLHEQRVTDPMPVALGAIARGVG